MNGIFTDKVIKLLNNAKETAAKGFNKGQEIITDIRIERLSKLSNKTIAGIGAVLAAIVVCGAFALSGEKIKKNPKMRY